MKKIVQTINSIRMKYSGKNSLEEALKIDPIAVGQSIYKIKVEA